MAESLGMMGRIELKLRGGLSPEHLEIIDESFRHEGHAGARPGGETHFRVSVVSESFTGKSRPERHRMIYFLLADEIKDRVHALSIKAFTPSEVSAPAGSDTA